MFQSSVVLSLVKSVESILKTDRLAAVSCVRISAALPHGFPTDTAWLVVVLGKKIECLHLLKKVPLGIDITVFL
jgi:hypothetical protein